MTPCFSIFIPVWNEARWLPGAIESVVRQSYPHWQLVIGDNASTEDLESVVEPLRDGRILYHRWPDHAETYENFNRTASLCSEQWVQLLCADDRLLPHCLEEMAARITTHAHTRRQRLAMVLGGARRFDEHGASADAAYYGVEGPARFEAGYHDARSWLMQMTVPGVTPWNFGAVAINREVLAETGGFFRPEIGLCSDLEAALRVAAYGEVAYIDQPLMDYTVRGDSDRSSRATRNRARRDPLTPKGLALLSALRAHEERRQVASDERAQLLAAVARWQLQRATQHRYLPGGKGRLEALLDIVRALGYSPRTVLHPRGLVWALAAIALPRGVLERVRSVLLARRARQA